MIYRISVTLLSLLATLSISESAFASQICSLVKEAPGALAADGNNGKILASKLVTTATLGGSPMKVLVTCSQSASLTISDPIQVNGSEFKPVSAFATVTTPLGISGKSGQTPLVLPAGTTPLVIDFSIDKGSPLKPGQYNFIVRFNFAL
jgi:hypothetical protein